MIQAVSYRLVEPKQLRLHHEMLDQRTLADSQILCRTLFSAISPGTELAAYEGHEPLRPTPEPYPRWLGYMAIGEVIAVGQNLASVYRPRTVVYARARHASHFMVSEHDIFAEVPSGVDLIHASLAYLYRLAWVGLRRGKTEPGRRVGIVGLGVIGQCAAQLALLFGCEIIAVSRHASALAAAAGEGAYTYTRDRARAYFDQSREEDRCDVVLVTSNSWEDWAIALRMTRFAAVVSVIGFPGRAQPAPTNNPLASQYFYDRQLTIVSAGIETGALPGSAEAAETRRGDIGQILTWIAQKKLRPGLFCIGTHRADDLGGAYRRLQADERPSGTIILDWRT